jgi:hypothetical protein
MKGLKAYLWPGAWPQREKHFLVSVGTANKSGQRDIFVDHIKMVLERTQVSTQCEQEVA